MEFKSLNNNKNDWNYNGCWNCRHGAEIEFEKEWRAEQVVEVKKDVKPKHKNPN